MSTFIDIHAIQTVPPSNLNRDDSGSPKTALYGGVRRARVSSQSWKKAMRDWFGLQDDADILHGLRTRNLQRLIIEDISKRNVFNDLEPDERDERIQELSDAIVQALGFDPNAKNSKMTQYLILISKSQVRDIVDVVLNRIEPTSTVFNKDDKKLLKTKLNGSNSVDLAAFGRMIADDVDLNVDASVQVAHAIGVDAVQTEFDYFTAVDDMANEKGEDDKANAGAGMIGNVEYDSATFYRYANIGISQLEKNLEHDEEFERRAVEALIKSFIESVPSGKQNTFAAWTLPSLVLIEIRDSRPLSYVQAFEKPVRNSKDESVSTSAVKTLMEYVENIDAQYGSPVKRYVLDLTGAFGLGYRVSYPELPSIIANAVIPYNENTNIIDADTNIANANIEVSDAVTVELEDPSNDSSVSSIESSELSHDVNPFDQ